MRNNDGAVKGEKIMAKYIGMIETMINSFKICMYLTSYFMYCTKEPSARRYVQYIQYNTFPVQKRPTYVRPLPPYDIFTYIYGQIMRKLPFGAEVCNNLIVAILRDLTQNSP